MSSNSNVKFNVLYIVLKHDNTTYGIQEQMYAKTVQNVN